MPSGLLRIRGTVDVAQFWPVGTSDADTIKVTIDADATAVAFRRHPGARFKPTRAFEGAVVKGRTTKAPIDADRRITVRLQGIDAPELHYLPVFPDPKSLTPAQKAAFRAAKGEGEFRQALAEAATLALTKRLGKGALEPLLSPPSPG